MKATLTGFGAFKKNTDYKVVYTATVSVDDFTGVEVSTKKAFVVANKGLWLKPFIGKQVELDLVKSPTLKCDVVVAIKEVK